MPVEIQARIASIQTRFGARPTTDSPASATPAMRSQFAASLASMTEGTPNALLGADAAVGTDALASLFGAAGTSTPSGILPGLSAHGLSGSQQQLIASALASRNAALGISGVGTSAIGSAGGVSPVAPDTGGRIASTSTVEGIERTLANGRLDTSQLTPIGVGSHRLHPEAASAFRQLMAAATADGIDIGVTDSYRSYDAQVDVARRKGLYSQGGLAAKPGTSSHGYGLAVDLDLDSRAQSWMRDNGARFGFVENTPREPWHWKFDGV